MGLTGSYEVQASSTSFPLVGIFDTAATSNGSSYLFSIMSDPFYFLWSIPRVDVDSGKVLHLRMEDLSKIHSRRFKTSPSLKFISNPNRGDTLRHRHYVKMFRLGGRC